MKTFGFIGTGNMGGALCRALCRAVPAEQVALFDRAADKAQTLANSLGAHAVDLETLVAQSDCIFLGVKPQVLPALLDSLRPLLKHKKSPPVLISMAAGVTTDRIQKRLNASYPLIRIMPNTPASVGEGLLLVAESDTADEATVSAFCAAMQGVGCCARLPESMIDAASAVSGCGPAFVYLFIEALSDGGVACGLPRDKALAFAAQTVLGAARMVLESGKHPAELKDAVCSPGGTTIAGVQALEDGAFRAAAMQAVAAAYQKTCALRDEK